MENPVSEFDVLVNVAIWLVQQGCTDLQASIAKGQGKPLREQKEELKRIIDSHGFASISFNAHGPDLIGVEHNRIWKVECKGLSDGSPQTVRNNFDRAVASVVSYYDEPETYTESNLSAAMNQLQGRDKPIRLVLALPHSNSYIGLIRKRIKPALRRRLDLWILVVDSTSKAVQQYDPLTQL